jgi:thioredoxin type arsenate reductase
MKRKAMKVLFLCTANSCRSQMAEGFARQYGSGIVEPYSAGAHPTSLHPLAVEVMKEVGVDISRHHSKGIADVPQDVDLVVTVCDQAAEACPIFPGAAKTIHWSVPDPVQARGTPEEIRAAFRRARDDIDARVKALVEDLSRDPR